jgi:hypothetical protein
MLKTMPFRLLGTRRSILPLTVALAWQVAACSSTPPGTGTGTGSCADCAQEDACCQALLKATGNTTNQCSTTEAVCASIDDIEEQRCYIGVCDGLLMEQAMAAGHPAVCKWPP